MCLFARNQNRQKVAAAPRKQNPRITFIINHCLCSCIALPRGAGLSGIDNNIMDRERAMSSKQTASKRMSPMSDCFNWRVIEDPSGICIFHSDDDNRKCEIKTKRFQLQRMGCNQQQLFVDWKQMSKYEHIFYMNKYQSTMSSLPFFGKYY